MLSEMKYYVIDADEATIVCITDNRDIAVELAANLSELFPGKTFSTSEVIYSELILNDT